jgi:hypothetical protein
MIETAKIAEFWNWFQEIASSLAQDLENPSLVKELDTRIGEMDSNLSWEIGPGSHEPSQFVISPNLDRDLREKAREIISRAPVIQGWEFYSARRPKDWDYKFAMHTAEGREPIQLDASTWSFVLLQYPDGIREVLLQGNNLPPLDDDERWQAAAIALESILGEEVLLDRIGPFELVDQLEGRFAGKQRPIHLLREAVMGG